MLSHVHLLFEVDLWKLEKEFGMCYFNNDFKNIAGKKCFWNR